MSNLVDKKNEAETAKQQPKLAENSNKAISEENSGESDDEESKHEVEQKEH